MKTRIAIIDVSLFCSIILYILQPGASPEDAPLMNTVAGRLGAWSVTFLVCLVLVGMIALVGKGILRLIQRFRR